MVVGNPVNADEGELTSLPVLPIGAAPTLVRVWFAEVLQAEMPFQDGSLRADRSSAAAYAQLSKTENTRRAYVAAVRMWCAWCEQRGVSPLPASSANVAAFLASERARKIAPKTLDLRRSAIRYLHRIAGCPVPTDDACVAATLAGIHRTAAGEGQHPRKKKAATVQVLRRLLEPMGDDLAALRDRALLLVGFAGALRRSELVAIRVNDLEHTERGLRVRLGQTKGSQTAAVTVPLPYGDTELCPVRALDRWVAAAGITEGPVFRRLWRPKTVQAAIAANKPVSRPLPQLGTKPLSDRALALIVQSRAVAAGFSRLELGGHSLKRGALTTGMDRGVHPTRLKRLGRHKSFEVLGEYLEFGDLFEGHPLSGVI